MLQAGQDDIMNGAADASDCKYRKNIGRNLGASDAEARISYETIKGFAFISFLPPLVDDHTLRAESRSTRSVALREADLNVAVPDVMLQIPHLAEILMLTTELIVLPPDQEVVDGAKVHLAAIGPTKNFRRIAPALIEAKFSGLQNVLRQRESQPARRVLGGEESARLVLEIYPQAYVMVVRVMLNVSDPLTERRVEGDSGAAPLTLDVHLMNDDIVLRTQYVDRAEPLLVFLGLSAAHDEIIVGDGRNQRDVVEDRIERIGVHQCAAKVENGILAYGGGKVKVQALQTLHILNDETDIQKIEMLVQVTPEIDVQLDRGGVFPFTRRKSLTPESQSSVHSPAT